MKIASLFSGIGGFESGILQADLGAEIVFASEFDPDSKAKHINNQPARQIYKKNFGEYPHGDITKIKSTDVPDHDILVGGPPCQGFSIAGKREGLCGAKGSMFYEFIRIRIARDKQPMLLLIENVKGILSSNGGWDFAKVLIELEDAGYICEWQVCNTAAFLPQNRERVFIIGHLGSGRTRKIFPIGNSLETILKPGNGNDISTGCISTRNQSGQAQWDGSTTLISNAIDANYRKGIDNHGQRTAILCDSGQGRKDQLRNETIAPLRANTGAGHNNVVCHSTLPRDSTSGKGGTGHLQRDDGLSYCCDANNSIAVEQPTVKRTPLKFMGRNQKNYDDGDYAFTIDLCNTGGVEVDKRIRRLLPIEAERLQGFPDNWTAEGINNDGDRVKIADTNRYKCLGNAVTVPVIEFIATHIFKMIRDTL
jgi:DNA (cytosine-5)-methyltransferase 1